VYKKLTADKAFSDLRQLTGSSLMFIQF